MTTTKPVTGTIMAILDADSIVVLTLGVDEGQIVPVYFDRRPFEDMLASERCEARDIIGRRIAYGDGAMVFLDECAASTGDRHDEQ